LAKRNDIIATLQARDELRRRRKEAPLRHFEPHAKQGDFFAALRDVRGAMMVGGNRSGKTMAHACMILAVLYGYRIWEVPDLVLTDEGDYPPREKVDPKYWIRRPDGVPIRMPSTILSVTGLTLEKGIGTIMWPALEALLPIGVKKHADFHVRRGAFSVPIRVTLPNGSEVRFGSIQQGSMTFEGANYTAAGFDEPPDRPCFTAVWRGLIDQYAPWWMTFTPLGANSPWIYNEFVSSERNDVKVVYVAQSDNPHLPQDALKEFEEGVQFSEEDLQARKFGRFGFLTHRAFPTFDPQVHVIESFTPPSSWPRVCTCDPANRRPFFFAWLAWDPRREDWHVYREYPSGTPYMKIRSSNLTVRDYASIVRNMEGGEQIARRWIDPRFGPAEYSVKGQRMTSVVDDFGEFGLYFDPEVPDTGAIETGIVRLRELLSYNEEQANTEGGLTEFNRPHLYVHDSCINVIDGFTNLSFVPPDARKEDVLPEKVLEAYKDPIDAIRYAVLGGPPVIDPDLLHHRYISARALKEHNNPRRFEWS
jgi:hypothetical protein